MQFYFAHFFLEGETSGKPQSLKTQNPFCTFLFFKIRIEKITFHSIFSGWLLSIVAEVSEVTKLVFVLTLAKEGGGEAAGIVFKLLLDVLAAARCVPLAAA